MESTLTTLISRLNAHKGHWPKVAEASGVPISTLRKIAGGHIKNPGVDSVDKLFGALDALSPPARQQ